MCFVYSRAAQFSCDLRLSELLYLPLPSLPTTSQKSDSILIGSNSNQLLGGDDEIVASGGKWEDEEERRFFEDVQDLKDFVPASVLGVEGTYEAGEDDVKELEQERLEREREEVRKLEEELENLGGKSEDGPVKPKLEDQDDDELVLFSRLIIILLTFAQRADANSGHTESTYASTLPSYGTSGTFTVIDSAPSQTSRCNQPCTYRPSCHRFRVFEF